MQRPEPRILSFESKGHERTRAYLLSRGLAHGCGALLKVIRLCHDSVLVAGAFGEDLKVVAV